MKTIRQIAEEIGVTRQAVYYKIDKPPLSKALQPFVSKRNGVLTVSVDGEMLIKQTFLNSNCQEKLSKENSSFDSELIKSLVNSVDTLKSQIKELTIAVKAQTENINKAQQNKSYYPKKKAIRTKAISAPIDRLMGNTGNN